MSKKQIKTWESKRDFKEEVYKISNKLKVKVNRVTIREMNKKWASCSTHGFFTFNIELLGMERKFGEYVILHEIMHLRVPNHSKLWKSLMEAHMPDYKEKEVALKVYEIDK